jgi:H+/gluconate symporter-like permease
MLHTRRVSPICAAPAMSFFTGFYMGDPPEQTYQTIKKAIAGCWIN